MKLEINIQKKHALFLGIIIAIASIISIAIAYNPDYVSNPNPFTAAQTFGHSADEIVVDVPGGSPYGLGTVISDFANRLNSLESAGGGTSGLKAGAYRGKTSSTYNGAQVGGYAGGDTKCVTEFPGSHMCSTADFALYGIPPIGNYGWYSSYLDYYFVTNAYSSLSAHSSDCGGWASSNYLFFGQVWGYNSPGYNSCNNSSNILCCG